VNQEPLPGRFERPWCPACRAPAGRDCPGKYRAKKATRRLGRREAREILALYGDLVPEATA
jgi:hypothetical protein